MKEVTPVLTPQNLPKTSLKRELRDVKELRGVYYLKDGKVKFILDARSLAVVIFTFCMLTFILSAFILVSVNLDRVAIKLLKNWPLIVWCNLFVIAVYLMSLYLKTKFPRKSKDFNYETNRTEDEEYV